MPTPDARYLDNPVYGGQRVPNVARQSASVWGQYRWDAQWRSGAGIYAQSARFADEANTTVLPGYARIDLVQGWTQPLGAGRSLELQFAIRNLFDRQYFVSSHLHVSRWITPGAGGATLRCLPRTGFDAAGITGTVTAPPWSAQWRGELPPKP